MLGMHVGSVPDTGSRSKLPGFRPGPAGYPAAAHMTGVDTEAQPGEMGVSQREVGWEHGCLSG